MVDLVCAIDLLMDEFVREFGHQVSHRFVTRNFRPREDMEESELAAGVITLLFEGYRPAENEKLAVLRVAVVGQVELQERSQPLDVERAELQMLAEFRRFVNGAAGAEWHVMSVGTSHQIEHPFGWFYATCDVGPINLHMVDPDGGHGEMELLWGMSPKTGPGHELDYRPAEEFFGG